MRVQSETTVSGVGLHSGLMSRVRLFRDDGVQVRLRRAGCEMVLGLEHVVATSRRTVLGAGGVRVALVEHLLAALVIVGWWRGLVIDVDADELPILDGSAAPWCDALAELGTPPPAPSPWVIERAQVYRDGVAEVRLEPGPTQLCAEIDFPHPSIGAQRWCGAPERYGELAAARTFGFLAEVDALRRRGLIAGADLENAIVFGEYGPLRPLRYADEPVRHKALDFVGDSFLLGRPLAGRVAVRRGSHQLHVSALRSFAAEQGAE